MPIVGNLSPAIEDAGGRTPRGVGSVRGKTTVYTCGTNSKNLCVWGHIHYYPTYLLANNQTIVGYQPASYRYTTHHHSIPAQNGAHLKLKVITKVAIEPMWGGGIVPCTSDTTLNLPDDSSVFSRVFSAALDMVDSTAVARRERSS